ncbi:MAG TPA: hypothetical protein VFA76_04960 [Terriglobales bacterium]|nr:hypothetical protein [Terriglobales bacterium]
MAAAQNTNPQRQQTDYFGSSGGNIKDSTSDKCCSGTLGSLLTDGTKKFILSNNHVLGLLGKATPGDPISQPGLIDTACATPRAVAKFTAAPPLSSNVDAAIAEILEGKMDSEGKILSIGQPSNSTVAPVAGLSVLKSGRTTGLTAGSIQTYPTNLKVDYSGGCKSEGPSDAPFTDLMVIEGKSSAFSAGGDSGSLVVTETSHSPVGLLFAGNDSLTLATPIGPVLNELSKVYGHPLTFLGSKQASIQVQSENAAAPQNTQATSAMNQLSERILSNPAILGVGVAKRTEDQRNPVLIVYVERGKATAATGAAGITFSAQGGTEYHGVATKIIETEPFRAYGWNEIERPESCH